MSSFKIEHLKDNPGLLYTVAQWIYNEWWTEKEGVSRESMATRLREAKTHHEIPLSLVALVDGELAGTVNLIESDNTEFPELRPWLAALLVHPNYRHQGIATKLVKECLRHAKNMNEKELFLGTDIPKFYEALGAQLHTEGSKNLKIMKFEL